MQAHAADTHMTDMQGSDTNQSSTQEALPGLPDHLVVTHNLQSEYLGDPADASRLRMVSPAMHDAVAATGCPVALTFPEVLRRGYLHRLLNPRASTWLDADTICRAAASAGKLSVLQWARANGCPWDKTT